MQVIPAKHIGFCFGVKRAISLAREAASQGTVYTYGALIHNGDVIARLEQEGIHAVKTLEEIPQGATAVIRSHGLSPRKPGGFGKPRRQGAGRHLPLCGPDP